MARPALPRRDPSFRFLGLFAFLSLLFAVTWNRDPGGQRDWHLLSPGAVPAALVLAYPLHRVPAERRTLSRAGGATVAAQAYHTAAWICQNALPWAWAGM